MIARQYASGDSLSSVTMNKNLPIALFIIITVGTWLYHVDLLKAQSTNQDNIDDAVQNIENEVTTPDDIDDLMEGFEDEPAEDAASPREEKDEFLEGFDEDTGDETVEEDVMEEQPSTWSLDGEFRFFTTYNFNSDATSPWRGFTMLRPELELTLKKKFSENWQGQIGIRGFYDFIYVLRGRDEYTRQVLDEYEKELELEDTFIQGSLTASLDTKIGRQIVVWGTLDNLRVTDVLNPLDLRVPGLTDIDDLRLPVTMIKLDFYFSDWNLSGMVIPEIRFSKLPVFGSDFFPLPVPAPPEDIPDDGFQNAEYAAALIGTFSGWDLAFYGAYVYDDQAYAEQVSPGSPPQLVRKHPRIVMLGTASNLAVGNWLLKAEAAWLDGLKYTNTPGVTYSRLDLGGGLEYTGFSETTISLEAANRHIFEYNDLLKLPPDEIDENEFQWALRFMQDYLNDTLTFSLLISTFGIKADDGAFERLDAEYDITDAVSIRGGVVFYQSGDKGIFKNISANDRLFFEVRYSF